MMGKIPVRCIGGPTASGKSSYALKLAQEIDGVIINADSQQVYQEIPILSAQPSVEDQEKVPHMLYGILPGSQACSAHTWQEMAIEAILKAHQMGKVPIVVGGTGLYLSAIIDGLSAIPEVSAEIRQEVREIAQSQGVQSIRALLDTEDPEMAEILHPNDTQRQTRALEVIRSSGKSLKYWQSKRDRTHIEKFDCSLEVINRPRDELKARAISRIDQMF
ncbi:MAG: tRNA (adenosine(37)-N6)-dimethylallyltransferase MiaA, partial [Alphaproteobacteria bacterium]